MPLERTRYYSRSEVSFLVYFDTPPPPKGRMRKGGVG